MAWRWAYIWSRFNLLRAREQFPKSTGLGNFWRGNNGQEWEGVISEWLSNHREEGVACHCIGLSAQCTTLYISYNKLGVDNQIQNSPSLLGSRSVPRYPLFWNTYEARESWRSGLLNGRQIVINCLRRLHVVTWKLRLPWSFCLTRMCLSDPCVFVNKQTVPFYRLLHKLFQQVWWLILPKDVSQSTSMNSCTRQLVPVSE